MRSYRCTCNCVIFFDNSQCLACGKELGFCPACRHLTALVPREGGYLCGRPECGAALAKCFNYAQHNVCNRCVAVEHPGGGELCDCCRFNDTIPDLSVSGNLRKWYLLEAAKRRLFYELDELGLPYGAAGDGVQPPLRFDFKADVIPQGDIWRSIGTHEKVFTGHVEGRITINVREADEVQRELLRVELGEAQRTLIGHFRHEIGHYYWDQLVKGRREEESRAVFGDHNRPTYAEALETYYKSGHQANWRQSFVSAYATMHPWEDFAETWATYLDMISSLDTAEHIGLVDKTDAPRADIDAMIARYQKLGLALNELNRSMGFIDLVPEVFVPPVIEKLRFVHNLVAQGRAENAILR